MAKAHGAISLGVSAVLLIAVIIVVGFGVYLNNTFSTTTVTTVTSTSSVSSSIASTGTNTTEVTPACNENVYNSLTNLSMENVPVLLMKPGSTGYICVTYQSAWQGNSTQFNNLHFQNETYGFTLSVGKEDCVTGGGMTSCSKIISNSFTINASPSSITPMSSTNYVSVVYTITALGNSTGFYDRSAPYEYCSGMPMAVGYSSSQVNASDFNTPMIVPCALLPFDPIGVSVGGMNVMYLAFSS